MPQSEASRKRKISELVVSLERFLGSPERPAVPPDPLEMLVATILSQNTNDANSHRAYLNLRKIFPTWGDVANAPLRRIVSAIRSGGMSDQKGRRLKKILRHIHHMFGEYSLDLIKPEPNGVIMERLLRFDGVGVKTAACVLLFSLRREVFPVDTHIHRILGRLGLSRRSKNPEETFRLMENMIPAGKAYSLHTNLIRFGRKTCRATNPLCGECPLYPECHFELKSVCRLKSRPGKSSRNVDFMLLDNV